MTEKDRLSIDYLYYVHVTGELDKAYSFSFDHWNLSSRRIFHSNLADTLQKTRPAQRAADLRDETARLERSPFFLRGRSKPTQSLAGSMRRVTAGFRRRPLNFDSLELRIQRLATGIHRR